MTRTPGGVELTDEEAQEVARLLGYAAFFLPKDERRSSANRLGALIVKELEVKPPCT